MQWVEAVGGASKGEAIFAGASMEALAQLWCAASVRVHRYVLWKSTNRCIFINAGLTSVQDVEVRAFPTSLNVATLVWKRQYGSTPPSSWIDADYPASMHVKLMNSVEVISLLWLP